ncbi:MAG: proteasome lid subunit RPN8/RPN11 [Planctomycetota bacterium]|jgi:proteasome lid subunit RPN8/RPN11
MDHVFAWRALSNIATDTARFRFDPAEYAREQERARALNLKILGVFHSHPGGPAHPSKDDEGQARALWGQGSSWLYLIVGLAEDSRSACRAWQLQGGFWREVRLRRLPLAPFSV